MGDDYCEVYMNDLEMTQLALMAWGVQALGERITNAKEWSYD